MIISKLASQFYQTFRVASALLLAARFQRLTANPAVFAWFMSAKTIILTSIVSSARARVHQPVKQVERKGRFALELVVCYQGLEVSKDLHD